MSIWRPAWAGAGAICAGVGLARFAYVPLFPAMVGAAWVDGGGAGLLGAANFAGYLLGVLSGRALGARLGVPRALDAGMALAALAFAAMAWNGGLAWFVLWRALAGHAGGVLMALAGPSVQASVPPEARGTAGGVVMSGVGAGVGLASLLVPLLLGAGGLPPAWLGLAGAVGLVWLALRRWWPDPPALAPEQTAAAVPAAPMLLLSYALSGAGMVAPMVYLADLAVRGHGLPVAGGAAVWALFGAGAVTGALAGGRIAGRVGGRRLMPAWMAMQVAALGLALAPFWALLPLAGFACGFSGVGATAVALAAARDIAGMRAGVVWVRATAGYAVAQAGTAFALAAVFAATGDSHAAVFGTGFVLSLAALAAAWLGRR